MSVRKRFLNSLIYPAFLIVLSIVMVAVIMTYVIPQFAELYRDLNVPLPLPTRILIAVSTTVQTQSMFVHPAIAHRRSRWLLALGRDRQAAGSWLDEMKLKAPILGNLWTMFSMAQLSRTLATLLQGGTPLLVRA